MRDKTIKKLKKCLICQKRIYHIGMCKKCRNGNYINNAKIKT